MSVNGLLHVVVKGALLISISWIQNLQLLAMRELASHTMADSKHILQENISTLPSLPSNIITVFNKLFSLLSIPLLLADGIYD